MVGRGAQMCGDEVGGVSAELVLCQTDDEALQRAGRKHQQERAANQLEEAVQPFEDDTDFEGSVNLGTRHRSSHRVWGYLLTNDTTPNTSSPHPWAPPPRPLAAARHQFSAVFHLAASAAACRVAVV